MGKTDEEGFKSVEQSRQLPQPTTEGDLQYVYTGKLSAPRGATPGLFTVRFPLNVAGAMDYVIVDTDYETYGLVCTCQGLELFFTYGHRRSCSILQRDPREIQEVTDKMKALVATLFPGGSAGDDFTKVKQEGCDLDKEVTSIDQEVDKLLGFADYASPTPSPTPPPVVEPMDRFAALISTLHHIECSNASGSLVA